MYSGDASPKTSATPPSLATRLPSEIVEIIIVYLTYDVCSLRACALVCYSWYIAAVPHLHHTLTCRPWYLAVVSRSYLCDDPRQAEAHSRVQNFEWYNSLRHKHMLGLLPLVKGFCIRRGCNDNHVGLSPTLFNHSTLRQFSALNNVLELEIEYMDIPNFMPQIRLYFGHFLPTLRCLTLREPKGSCR